jgi:hypothetical protein
MPGPVGYFLAYPPLTTLDSACTRALRLAKATLEVVIDAR